MPTKRRITSSTTSAKRRSTRYYLSMITLMISLMVLSTFLGFTYRTDAMFNHLLLEEARAFKAEVSFIRKWVWQHGGVYVRPGGKSAEPKREIVDQDGEILKQLNPAEVTQELARLSHKSGIVHFTSTSFNPLNPLNKADDFELAGLEKLREGIKEHHEFVHIDNKLVFRYMTPLVTGKSCIECHSDGSFQAGRVDSALSFKIPAEQINQKKQKNRIWMVVSGIAVIALVGLSIWFLSRRFIRQIEQADEILEKLAAEDVLTKLLNRRIGMEMLQSEVARCERKNLHLSLILLDIDHFKNINDTMGHQVGDEGLRALAKVMSCTLRDYDIAFRYGGEEFVIILPDEAMAGAIVVAERLRVLVADNNITTSDGQQLSYTVSLGVAQLQPGMDVKTLIAHADRALYQAKDQGRNCSVVYSE